MSNAGKLVALGVVVAGGVLLLMHSANAKPAQSGLPEGWTPPDGATFLQIPPGPGNATGLTLDVWRWTNTSQGGAPGNVALVVNHANPKADFAAFFFPATKDAQGGNQPPGVLALGTSRNSGLIAQAIVAGLVE